MFRLLADLSSRLLDGPLAPTTAKLPTSYRHRCTVKTGQQPGGLDGLDVGRDEEMVDRTRLGLLERLG